MDSVLSRKTGEGTDIKLSKKQIPIKNCKFLLRPTRKNQYMYGYS